MKVIKTFGSVIDWFIGYGKCFRNHWGYFVLTISLSIGITIFLILQLLEYIAARG